MTEDKLRRLGNHVELKKRPKKINSEQRKQQNRIASRNYREKRKRKLQYLQQLVEDGTHDEREPELPMCRHNTSMHSSLTELDSSSFSSSTHLDSGRKLHHSSSSTDTVQMPYMVTQPVPLNNNLGRSTQTFRPSENLWMEPLSGRSTSSSVTWDMPSWVPDISSTSCVTYPQMGYHEEPIEPSISADCTTLHTDSQAMRPISNPHIWKLTYTHYHGYSNHTYNSNNFGFLASMSYPRGHHHESD